MTDSSSLSMQLKLERIFKEASGLLGESPERALELAEDARRIIDSNPDPSWMVRFLKLESDICMARRDFQRAIEVSRKGLLFSEFQDEQLLRGDFLFNIGQAGGFMGRLNMSLEMLFQALGIYEKLGNRSKLARTHIHIGLDYRKLSDFLKAVDHFYKALAIYEELDDLDGISDSLSNIGLVNAILKNNKEALDAFERVLANREKLNDRKGVADALNRKAIVHIYSSQYEEAMECYRKSLAIKREFNDLEGVAKVMNNIGNLKNDQGDYMGAMESYEESLRIKRSIRDRGGIASTLSNIGNLLMKQDRLEESIEHLNESLQMARELSDTSLVSVNYLMLYRIEKSRENYEEALEYLKIRSQLQERLFDENTEKTVAERQIIYAIEQNEKETEIFRLKNEELSSSNRKLRDAIRQISELSGLLPICPRCKKVRDDTGFWEEVDTYFSKHSSARFTHGLCPECIKKYYGEAGLSDGTV